MSAFGRKNGIGGMSAGARPSFGVARPMKGGAAAEGPAAKAPVPGGEQFPPIPGGMSAGGMPPSGGVPEKADAMSRLQDRANNVVEGQAKIEGFEASVHKIKEQVLPRLLERVDPEAAALAVLAPGWRQAFARKTDPDWQEDTTRRLQG